MIGKVLEKIAELIGEDINSLIPEFLSDDIVLGNISQLEGNGGMDEGKIMMSLVNLEQDAPLRNNPAYTYVSDTQIKRHNPKVVLNLYVLFTAVDVSQISTSAEWDYLTYVIGSLQKKNVFDAVDLSDVFIGDDDIVKTEKVIFDLYSMTFEQLNHLWGILGGKYLPSVIYKVRLVCVFVDEEKEPEEVIQEIEPKENVLN